MSSPTVVQHKLSTGSNDVVFDAATTAGHRIIVLATVGQFSAGSPTWTIPGEFAQLGTTQNNPHFFEIVAALFQVKSCAGGSTTYTFTPSANGNFKSLLAVEVAGSDPSSADDDLKVTISSNGSDTDVAVTMTLTGSDDLLLGLLVSNGNSNAISAGSGSTLMDSYISSGGNFSEAASEYRVSTGTGDNAIDFAVASGPDFILFGVALKAAASAVNVSPAAGRLSATATAKSPAAQGSTSPSSGRNSAAAAARTPTATGSANAPPPHIAAAAAARAPAATTSSNVSAPELSATATPRAPAARGSANAPAGELSAAATARTPSATASGNVSPAAPGLGALAAAHGAGARGDTAPPAGRLAASASARSASATGSAAAAAPRQGATAAARGPAVSAGATVFSARLAAAARALAPTLQIGTVAVARVLRAFARVRRAFLRPPRFIRAGSAAPVSAWGQPTLTEAVWGSAGVDPVQMERQSSEIINVLIPIDTDLGPADPTGDAVQLAVVAHKAKPLDGDWQDATWKTVTKGSRNSYYARLLVGPFPDVTEKTTMDVFYAVTDSPERPVKLAGPLKIL